jgi:hypothetical protein
MEQAAKIFLYVSGVVFLVAIALPLLFAPLAWAKRFGWALPSETQLTVYFGRCLGALALSVIALVFRVAPEASRHPYVFELVAVIGAIVGLVHVWGFIKKEQPWLEHAEIPVYFALCGFAAWIRAGL